MKSASRERDSLVGSLGPTLTRGKYSEAFVPITVPRHRGGSAAKGVNYLYSQRALNSPTRWPAEMAARGGGMPRQHRGIRPETVEGKAPRGGQIV